MEKTWINEETFPEVAKLPNLIQEGINESPTHTHTKKTRTTSLIPQSILALVKKIYI